MNLILEKNVFTILEAQQRESQLKDELSKAKQQIAILMEENDFLKNPKKKKK